MIIVLKSNAVCNELRVQVVRATTTHNHRELEDMMDSTDNDKVKPASSLSRSAGRFVTLVVGIQILIALITYPFLPEMVPSHWNLTGQVNGYMPKWFSAVLLPGITIALYLLLRRLTAAGPTFGRDNQRTSVEFVDRILPALALFFLALQLITIATALHFRVNILFVVSLLTSLLFIYMGNFMGKLRRNFWAGIRTPWTLASDSVWERTHRLGSWLFVAIGLVGVVTSFIRPLRLWGTLGLLLLIGVVLYVYSYMIYHRLETNGKEPSGSTL